MSADPLDPRPEESQRRAAAVGWARMYALVLEFLAYLAFFGYVGWRVDERYGWAPWGLLAGLLSGLTIGLYRMIREAQKSGLMK